MSETELFFIALVSILMLETRVNFREKLFIIFMKIIQ